MKVEFLAGLLEKTPEELASDLKLEDGVEEVTPEVAKKQIDDHIANVKIDAEKAGVKKGEGKAERMHKKATETALKGLGIEGEKYEDLFKNLKTKLEAKPEDKNKDLIALNKSLNEKVEVLKKTISDRDTADALKAAKTKTRKTVTSKLGDTLKGFEFPSNEAREMAIDTFISNNEFTDVDGSIYLKKGEKVVTDYSEEAGNHFAKFGTKVDPKKKKPKKIYDDDTSYTGKSLAELNVIYMKTTDSKERAKLRVKMRELQKTG